MSQYRNCRRLNNPRPSPPRRCHQPGRRTRRQREPEPNAEAAARKPIVTPDPRGVMSASLDDDGRMQLLRSHRFKQVQIRFDRQPDEKYLAMLAEAGWRDRTEEEGIWTKQIPKEESWKTVIDADASLRRSPTPSARTRAWSRSTWSEQRKPQNHYTDIQNLSPRKISATRLCSEPQSDQQSPLTRDSTAIRQPNFLIVQVVLILHTPSRSLWGLRRLPTPEVVTLRFGNRFKIRSTGHFEVRGGHFEVTNWSL